MKLKNKLIGLSAVLFFAGNVYAKNKVGQSNEKIKTEQVVQNLTNINLIDVVKSGNRSGVRKILPSLSKESINACDCHGYNALHYAVMLGDLSVVKDLIKNGADVNALDASGSNALFLIADKKDDKNVRIAKYLANRGLDLNHHNKNSDVALFAALEAKNWNLIHALLPMGLYLDERDKDGNTALMLYASRGNSLIVGFLLFFDVDLNAVNNKGESLMDVTTDKKLRECFERLIKEDNMKKLKKNTTAQLNVAQYANKMQKAK